MVFTKEQAKAMSILEVAQSLGMEMKRHASQEYYWTQHDSLKINIRKNRFNWYSKGIGGDVIKLVETIKEVKFKEAMRFLETGNFSEVVPDTSPKAPFEYRLGAYEEAFVAARDYLKNQRGLSDETIDFFEKQGVLAQARYRNEDGHLEPVVVFKYFDQDKRLVGASLQGIVPDQERHEGKGYLKKILYNSDGLAGMSIDIGQPNRLVFAEAPIDLMSYYELHKDSLENVRLVSMDGLKEQTISRYFMELCAQLQGDTTYRPDLSQVGTALETAGKTSTIFKDPEMAKLITLAVDQDKAGNEFIQKLIDKGIKVLAAQPLLTEEGQKKMDWNDYLKIHKAIEIKLDGLNHQKENIIAFLEQNSHRFNRQAPYDYTIEGYDTLFFDKYEIGTIGIEELDPPEYRVEQAFEMLEWTAKGNHTETPDSDLTFEALVNLGYNSSQTYQRLYLGDDKANPNMEKIASYHFRGFDYQTLDTLVHGVEHYLNSSEGQAFIGEDPDYFSDLAERFLNQPMSGSEKLALINELDHKGLSLAGHSLSPLLLEAVSEDGQFINHRHFEELQSEAFDNYFGGLTTMEQELAYEDSQIEVWEELEIAQVERGLRLEKQEKSLEKTQGIIAETKLGDFPDGQGAAPLPEASTSQPLNDMSPHQTRSQPLLQFTISRQGESTKKDNYHPITDKELRKLNRYASNLQQAAQFYLNELAGTQLTYFYSDGQETGQVTVDFGKEHFMHLTGLFPVNRGQTAEQTLLDFAQGRGDFNQLLIANQGATFDKLQVLPELQEVIESDAFYFNDLTSIEKLHRLDLDKAIRTSDKDLLLALRTVDGTAFPASMMKLKQGLNAQLDHSHAEKIILGVYQNRDGELTQLSINDTYIKDGGREMMAIMEANLKETSRNHYEAIEAERQLDSDGDGISNEDEIRLGTDPHNASSRPGKEKEERQGERIDGATVSGLLAANDTQGLSQHLREGMRQYLDSDQYKTFLSAMSKFHNYSPQNVALLLAQNPEITAVASYQKWKNDFGRQVQKGEKGLKIRVPMTFTLKDENGQPKLDEQGKEVTVTRFKLGTVFDVSQTQGKPLPRPIYNLENDVLDYDNLYRAARHVSEQNGFPISFEKIDRPTANGYFDRENRRIVLADKQMSEAQIMKTLFHEMAHSDLLKNAPAKLTKDEYALGELQAESVAYVVANHYGIDTSDYSFGYLASWAQNEHGFEQFEAQLKIVQEEAKSLISRIDNALVLVKNKTLTQDKFQAKLNQAQAKQDSLLLTKEGQEQDLKKSQDMTKNLS